MTYRAPVDDMLFTLTRVAVPQGAEPPLDRGDLAAILDEAARFAEDRVAPLDRLSDTAGATWADGVVTTPPGFREAYADWAAAGWNGTSLSEAFGGSGLPTAVGTAAMEMLTSACLSLSTLPVLSQGAADAIEAHASEELKAKYLSKLVAGTWTGTMNLTEPQAGSDLAAVRTRAVPEGDKFRISGSKIFITYGDHEMAENIVHLVLARLPDAPPGVKGISLFLVPKVLVAADGSLGARNDVACASIEHKLGIHGSPTAVLVFGEAGGALGEIIGEPGRGLEYMFAMMNHARLNVGLQGLAIAERAHQQARAYAGERVQGKPVGLTAAAPIVAHPDVKRLLVSMRARIEAMRGLLYEIAALSDVAHAHPDAAVRARAGRRVDLLVPVGKGWSTETGCDVTSDGVQVHGGMGYIEETGAAQHFRDARITPIYEGTTAIQSNALVGRSVLRDRGAAVGELFADIAATVEEASAVPALADAAGRLGEALAAARASVDWIIDAAGVDPRLPYAAAVPFLHQLGVLTGGWMLIRAGLAAGRAADLDPGFVAARIAVAGLFAAQYLPQVAARLETIRASSAAVLAFPDAAL